jgi:hypothetical protein
VAHEALVRGVLEEATHQVGHAGHELAHRRVHAHALPHGDEGGVHGFGHPVEELELERRVVEAA